MFWSLFWVNNFFKMINVFATFASEDGMQLLFSLICNNFLVLCGKMPGGCGGCGSRQIMRIRTTASCQMPWWMKIFCRMSSSSSLNGWKFFWTDDPICTNGIQLIMNVWHKLMPSKPVLAMQTDSLSVRFLREWSHFSEKKKKLKIYFITIFLRIHLYIFCVKWPNVMQLSLVQLQYSHLN